MEILSSTAATSIAQNVPATEETVSEESMKTDDKETEMEDLETTYDTGLHETMILKAISFSNQTCCTLMGFR